MLHTRFGLWRTLIVAAALAAVASGCSGAGENPAGYGPGMMDGGGMMGFGAAGAASASVAPSEADRLGRAVPAGAVVDQSTSTLTFSGADVQLTALAAPSDGPDETFRIAGLTNPTIVFPAGARVTLELVNADPGMPHNWLLTTADPPFGPLGMMMSFATPGAATETLPNAGGGAIRLTPTRPPEDRADLMRASTTSTGMSSAQWAVARRLGGDPRRPGPGDDHPRRAPLGRGVAGGRTGGPCHGPGGGVRREHLDHLLRAGTHVVGDRELLVVGSQSLLGTWDEDELARSPART